MTEDQSINYFLEGSGNVVKNAELLRHLGYLEVRADNGGFTCLEFTKLSSVLVERRMPAQISRRFVNCLVPNQPVQGNFKTNKLLLLFFGIQKTCRTSCLSLKIGNVRFQLVESHCKLYNLDFFFILFIF